MQRLLLLMGRTPADALVWMRHGGTEGETATGTVVSLSELPTALARSEDITVVLPGEQAATRRLRLPVKRDAAIEAAARLAFEDVLATPTERYHFAFTEADEEGFRRVTAVPSAWLDEWLDVLADEGIDPDAVTIDHAALNVEGNDQVLLRDGRRAIARLRDGGMTLSMELAGSVVPKIEGANDAARVSVGVGRSDGVTLVLADGRALAGFYAAAIERVAPPNLLRGSYRRKQDWSGLLRQWRDVASVAAACLAVWFGVLLADGMRHAAAAKDIEAEATDLFTSAFPGTPVRDLSRQAAARARQGGTPLFLPLSAELAAAIEETVSVELSALRYQAGEGLVADVRFPEPASLETLRAQLETRGVRTEEGGNIRREDDGRYAGQLILGGFQ